MIAMLLQLVIQLFIAAVTLAFRLAWLIGSVLGMVLVRLIDAGWTAWRERRTAQAAMGMRDSEVEPPVLLPPGRAADRQNQFTPRPLRPRPRR